VNPKLFASICPFFHLRPFTAATTRVPIHQILRDKPLFSSNSVGTPHLAQFRFTRLQRQVSFCQPGAFQHLDVAGLHVPNSAIPGPPGSARLQDRSARHLTRGTSLYPMLYTGPTAATSCHNPCHPVMPSLSTRAAAAATAAAAAAAGSNSSRQQQQQGAPWLLQDWVARIHSPPAATAVCAE
jgi:hypothetical protein